MSESRSTIYIPDTNVLMDDPTAIFKFQEHGVYLLEVVLKELDQGKKGRDDIARNVRHFSRMLDGLMEHVKPEEYGLGLPLDTGSVNGNGNHTLKASGRLFLDIESENVRAEQLSPDDKIILAAERLQRRFPDRKVVIVSKDTYLRIRARRKGVPAEDYHNERVVEDIDLLPPGHMVLPEDFWDHHVRSVDSWTEEGRTYYRIEGEGVRAWHPLMCLAWPGGDSTEAVVRHVHENHALIELLPDYRRDPVWGINALNREQNYALSLLLDPSVEALALLGIAGTGKTLLTLAAGLHQVLEDNLYGEIYMTRVTVPVGEDIGFLPGTEQEKLTPWMGALMDNLDVLNPQHKQGFERGATQDLVRARIKIIAMNFIRGRTLHNKFLIIDEAQNLTRKQMKTLVSRAGPGTKVVCLGNTSQIDTPYLTETTSGLTHFTMQAVPDTRIGHLILTKGERSYVADWANRL